MSYDAGKLREAIENRNIGDYFYIGHEFSSAGVKTDEESELAMDLVYSYIDSGHLRAKVCEFGDEDTDGVEDIEIPFSSWGSRQHEI